MFTPTKLPHQGGGLEKSKGRAGMRSLLGPMKPLDAGDTLAEHQRLRKSLSWPHLVALGVGAIVGTGIYTLTGVGADRAGPAVILAFVVAGVVCACAALAYAEVATLMPAASGWPGSWAGA